MDTPINSTTNENDYSLFTIRQAARACNVSRSTLIRLEDKGLLTPAYTDAKSGYRYYDNDNISRILQIQKFQWMGFSPEEIIAYYESGGKADELLATLEEKLSVLQQQVTELRLHQNPFSSFMSARTIWRENFLPHPMILISVCPFYRNRHRRMPFIFTPAGYVRAIALVAPYVGREIDPQRYCSQLVLPIETPA